MKSHNFLLIHGRKPARNKALHQAFEERLKLGLELAQRNCYDLILITGGQTSKQFPPESQIGYEYLKDKTGIPIIQEGQSHTTVENILKSRAILNQYQIGHVDIITSQTRLRRVKYLYKQLWPELSDHNTVFGASDSCFFLYPLVELVYLLYAFLDIKEEGLSKLTKKIFRNAT
jgi:uncharacterized SAM-binding protein YcdF (DUF218 family)